MTEPPTFGAAGAFDVLLGNGDGTFQSPVAYKPASPIRRQWWSATSTMTATRTSRQATGPRWNTLQTAPAALTGTASRLFPGRETEHSASPHRFASAQRSRTTGCRRRT